MQEDEDLHGLERNGPAGDPSRLGVRVFDRSAGDDHDLHGDCTSLRVHRTTPRLTWMGSTRHFWKWSRPLRSERCPGNR